MAYRLSEKVLAHWLPTIIGLTFAHGAMAQNQVKESVDVQKGTVAQNKKSQKTIDSLSEKANRLLDEYRLVIGETESLKTYNDQLAKLVDSQNEEIASIEKQIGSIESTNREVVPLMLKMIDGLDKFVALDVPFLQQERQNRIAGLKEMMDRADVSTSEKFRRVLEAYQVENEYGRSIEAYSEAVEINGEKKTVDFLRFGRIVLISQTLDGKVSQVWDQHDRKWRPLDDSYSTAIKDGLKIARKQSAPYLINLPVSAPEVVK